MSPPQQTQRSDEFDEAPVNSICFDMHEWIRRALNSWQPQADGKGVQLLCELLPGVPQYVTGDAARLGQVLDNLLSNAFKFTRAGSVHVAVDNMCLDDTDSAMLRFAIQDSGVGMSRQTLANLFTQLAPTDGLDTDHGLTICKQLIETMQGEIMVDSAEGLGTCITIVVPFAHAAAGPSPQESTLPTQRHILVVDDNDTNRIVCTALLEQLGYRTATAVGGLEAVAAAKRDRYDLILMDCHMPVVDGLEATRSIRTWERSTARQALPIIAVSASAFADDRQRCADAGMNDFLPKPITVSSLRLMLDSWLVPAEQTPTSRAGKLEAAAPSVSPAAELKLSTQIFCHAQFTETRTLAGAKFGKILLRFAEDAQHQLVAMQQALDCADAEALRRSAHKLKGSSGSIGAHQLAKLCSDLELSARTGALVGAENQVAAIDHCRRTTMAALQPFMDAG